MVYPRTTAGEPFTAAMDKASLAYPFDAPFDVYAGFARRALDVVADGLQAQADYVRSLAACKNPADVLTCSNTYACHVLEACFEAGQKAASLSGKPPQA